MNHTSEHLKRERERERERVSPQLGFDLSLSSPCQRAFSVPLTRFFFSALCGNVFLPQVLSPFYVAMSLSLMAIKPPVVASIRWFQSRFTLNRFRSKLLHTKKFGSQGQIFSTRWIPTHGYQASMFHDRVGSLLQI